MVIRSFGVCLCALVLLAALSGGVFAADAVGSEDHPLVSRVPGSSIVFFHQVDYDETRIPLSGVQFHRDDDHNLVPSFSDSLNAAGRMTHIQYSVPQNHSPTEIFRSHVSALEEAGFELLFSGVGEELGRNFGQVVYPSDLFFVRVSHYARCRLLCAEQH